MGLFDSLPLTEKDLLANTHLNLISRVNMLNQHNYELQAKLQLAESRIAELEHQMKVECDTYLWNRKRMSRRIAMLEYWMDKLFKYANTNRNELTMTAQIPDTLIREGEDLLLQTPTLEKESE